MRHFVPASAALLVLLTGCQRQPTPTTLHTLQSDLKQGNVTEARAIIESGFDVNTPSPNGNTALTTAAKYGRLDIVQLLLDKGANINQTTTGKHDTALMFAAWKNQLDVARLLCERGAEVNSRTTDGDTALIYAAQEGNTEIVKLLLSHGAALNEVAHNGATAYKLALGMGHPDTAQIIQAAGGQ